MKNKGRRKENKAKTERVRMRKAAEGEEDSTQEERRREGERQMAGSKAVD